MVSEPQQMQSQRIEVTNTCCSNEADLKILENMGIKCPPRAKEAKPTLKQVGLMIIATVRMKKMQEAWADNKKIHEALLKKLDSMRQTRSRGLLKP